MQGAAVVDIGISADTFWNLTPREWTVYEDRFRKREERADRRAGLIASTIANWSGLTRDPGKHPQPFTVEEMLGYPQHLTIDQEVACMRDLLDYGRAVERYVDGLKASDPQSEVTMAKAVTDMVATNRGKWSKLGTRDGLMQPLNVALAMQGKLQ
jgi:hypothetical protein